MIIIYTAAACLIAYGFLFGFRQVQSLQERIARLESEKQETEALLLSFMESMSDLVTNEPIQNVESMEIKEQSEQTISDTQKEEQTEHTSQLDIEDVLLRHSVRDAARLLGRGEGEMALYAKLRKK